MGKASEETYFPRGRTSSSKPALRKKKEPLFKKPVKKAKKKTTFQERITKKSKEDFKIRAPPEIKHGIKSLKYQTLEEGMVLVGRLREVFPYHMFVCLPGRLSARVTLTGISAPYTDSLEKLRALEITEQECPPLTEMFQPGETVVCSVVEIKKDGELLSVTASLDPQLVNVGRSHASVRAGQTLTAAVRSEEDHGYTLDTGVARLTAFLKFKDAESYVKQHNNGRKLAVGEVVRCLVTKCAVAKSSSRAEVVLDPGRVSRAILDDEHINAQTLLPGATVRCTVSQSLPKGLVLSVGTGIGYVERSQLTDPWSSPEDFPPDSELRAHVLYTLPHADFQMTAKPVYLTLKNIHSVVVPRIAVGEVLPAVVTHRGFKGVWVCLGEQQKNNSLGNKGLISVRRLGEDVKGGEIADKFPPGTQLTTRVLAYDYMEQVYNCSMEQDKLEQQYLKLSQLSVGDRVTCLVNEVLDNGLRLRLGSIRLFAFKEHSADIPYPNLHKHFAPGDIVDARILKVTESDALVTLKETLIRSPALTSYEMANKNDCYWGTVRHVKDTHVYVMFYNDVGGSMRVHKSDSTFIAGHLVKCYVNYVNAAKEKLLLTPAPDGEKNLAQLAVGEQYQLVVTQTDGPYLTVEACDYDGIEGSIPKCHLPEPCTFQEGDFVKAWLYLKRNNSHYFSPHPAVRQFVNRKEEVELNSKIMCCVASINDKKITVFTPLLKYPVVTIPRKVWFREVSDVKEHQLALLYVENFDSKSKKIKLTCNAEDLDLENLTNVTTTGHDETSDYFTDDALGKNDNPAGKKRKKNKKSKLNENSKDDLEPAEKRKKVDSDSVGQTSKQSELVDKQENKSNKRKKKGEGKHENTVIEKRNSNKEDTVEEETDDNTRVVDKSQNKDTSKKPNKKKKQKKKGDKLEESKEVNDENDESTLEDNFDEDQSEEDEEDSERPQKSKKSRKENILDKPKPTLSETGFFWDIKPEDLNKTEEEAKDDSDEEVEESGEGKSKKRKSGSERRREAREAEARLREVERILVNSESDPQSPDQFDRAVLARPDDADLWIKYMSHHLQATEIEKARAVARRALNTINQRCETERLNVWIALLNLENLFGTQECLKKTLDEALRTNDEFMVYSKMLQIYSQSKKSQEAEHLVNIMLRKFRSLPQCWLQCCSALMACEVPDKARNILQRAVTALPNKDHVNLLVKFALLENQHGFSEQAQTLFEHILTSYPKRIDVWNVYVDMLVKADKLDVARQVLERATRQKLPARKMKMLFSKWISLEERLDCPENVEKVKKLALAYVNNITKALDS